MHPFLVPDAAFDDDEIDLVKVVSQQSMVLEEIGASGRLPWLTEERSSTSASKSASIGSGGSGSSIGNDGSIINNDLAELPLKPQIHLKHLHHLPLKPRLAEEEKQDVEHDVEGAAESNADAHNQ